MPLLAIDVGAGTQDILLYREEVPLEGSSKMVLPSPTVIVAERIGRARTAGRDVFLRGPTMGGGSSSAAVHRHLEAGLGVYATPTAAATLNDNLDRVRKMGVTITEDAPEGAEVVQTGDVDLPAIGEAFGLFGLDLPRHVAVAVQDHGFSPTRSNRIVRFEIMSEAIAAGGRIEDFAYRKPPEILSRMAAVHDYLKAQGYLPLLMDTGPAALFGAAADPRFREPGLLINFGNGHTVAGVMIGGRLTSLFEHHTSELSPGKLKGFMDGLVTGGLKNSEVFDDGGHGSYIEEAPGSVKSVVVTGPRREPFLMSLDGAVAAAPGGDMMIAGCIGLLEAWMRCR